MELVDDVCHMESCFGPFVPNAPKSKKPFWTHYLVLLGEEAQVEAWFG